MQQITELTKEMHKTRWQLWFLGHRFCYIVKTEPEFGMILHQMIGVNAEKDVRRFANNVAESSAGHIVK